MALPPRSRRRLVLSLLVAIALVLAAAPVAAQLRPLVRSMLESVAALDGIGGGLATLDFARIRAAAEQLQAVATGMRDEAADSLGIESDRKQEFDGFLSAQLAAAGSVREAAQARDANGVLLGLRSVQAACVSCHARFRTDERQLRPSALFMTSLLSSWQDMNHGVMTDDYELVVRRAREIQATARVFSWDQVLRATFDIAEPSESEAFRRLLGELTKSASRVEYLAMESDQAGVLDAMNSMWNDSCLSCHERFRGPSSLPEP